MNKIITTSISDPSIQQPFTGKSLDFLQNSTKDMINAMARGIIERAGRDPSSTTTPYEIVSSDSVTKISYIYFNGEVYAIDYSVSIPGANIATVTVTDDPTADPVVFTDAISRNVHNVRGLVRSAGTLGTGTFDLVDIVSLKTIPSITPTLINSWTSYTDTVLYKKDGSGMVTITGNITKPTTNASNIFVLPSGYRPSSTKYFQSAHYDTAGGYVTNFIIINTSGQVYVANAVAATTIIVYLDGISFYTS
jgi:hypothetical protein